MVVGKHRWESAIVVDTGGELEEGIKNEPEISFVGRTASSDLLHGSQLLNRPWASTPEPVGIFHNENIIAL